MSTKEELKELSFSDLKKIAKKKGLTYKDLSDDDKKEKKLIKRILEAQKSSRSSSPSSRSPKSPKKSYKKHKSPSPKSHKKSKRSPSPKKDCGTEFSTYTHCYKDTSAATVKKYAEDCDLDMTEFNTKPKQCAELFTRQGGPKKSSKTAAKPSNQQGAEYKSLNKLKKKDTTGKSADLEDVAKELKISYVDQDGATIAVGKARKQSIINAILESGKWTDKLSKKYTGEKRPVSSPKKSKKKSPSPSSSKKSSSPRSPSPKKSKKSKKSKKKTPSPSSSKKSPSPKKVKTPSPKKSPKKTCDPANESYCDDDMVCNVDKKKCISPSKAAKKIKKGLSSFEYQGKTIVGSENAIESLKGVLDQKEFMGKQTLLNKISVITGKPKSLYNKLSVSELKDKLQTLEQTEINERQQEENEEQRRAEEDAQEEYWKNKAMDEAFTEQEYDEMVRREQEDKADGKHGKHGKDRKNKKSLSPKKSKKKTPTPSSSLDDSEDIPISSLVKKKIPTPDTSSESEEEVKPKKSKKGKKKTPTPSSSIDSSESEDEETKPSEGTEVIDVESMLANVTSDGKKLGDLDKVQKSILKCLGLMA